MADGARVIDHLELKAHLSAHSPSAGRENDSLKCRNDDKYDFDVINSTTKVHFARRKISLRPPCEALPPGNSQSERNLTRL